MNCKLVCLGLLLIASCMMVSAQFGSQRRVRLVHGDYDCSCSYYCPSYGIKGGRCFSDNDDYWGYGHIATYCCIPSGFDDFGRDYDNVYNPYRGIYGFNSRK